MGGKHFVPFHRTCTSILFVTGLMTGCGGSKGSQQADSTNVAGKEAMIEGTASYRERILLPRTAIFEAYLQDVSSADAPATEIARTSVSDIRDVPILFAITYDPARIDEHRAYSVRARILIDGELW